MKEFVSEKMKKVYSDNEKIVEYAREVMHLKGQINIKDSEIHRLKKSSWIAKAVLITSLILNFIAIYSFIQGWFQ